MRLLPEVLELGELAIDLDLDVERLAALASPALVSGDDELAHLGAQPRVGARRD